MVHATLLAEATARWFNDEVSEADALTSYHALRNADGLADYERTVLIARDLRQLTPQLGAPVPA